jgi:hypothetical protein
MRTTWVRGSTIALAAASTLLIGAPAWADAGAVLRSGQAPATAAGFSAHSCDAAFGGGPFAGTDVWSFVLPDTTRQFVTLTAMFDTNRDGSVDATLSTPASGGIRDAGGTSKGWIVAPAGATLLGATATVTGTQASPSTPFNLDRTCPAAAPSASPSASASPKATRPSASPRRSSSRSGAANRGSSTTRNAPASPVGVPYIEDSPDESQVSALSESSDAVHADPAAASTDAGTGLSLVLGTWAVLAMISCATAFFLFRRNRYGTAVARNGRHHLDRGPK